MTCICTAAWATGGKHTATCDAQRAAPPDTKPTNPKDAIGSSKVPFSVIPLRVLAELGLALLEGAAKYRRHNYRRAGVRASVYFDATHRHLAAWWEGQDVDPDSGLNHVTKAIASLTVLRDSMLQGNWQDDRPPRVSDPNWVAKMNARAAAVLARFPAPLAPCTEAESRAVEYLEPPAADEPQVRLRCGDCGRTWPMDQRRTCPECFP